MQDLIDSLAEFGKVLFTGGEDRSQVCAFGRERELELLAGHLTGERARRSVILLGPSGSGKTALLHELARRAMDWPEPWLFLETSSSMMLVGTRYLGDWQTRVKRLIDRARAPNRVVVYFTDMANVPTVGKSENVEDSVGSFMIPFLQSGELVLFGETDPEQYRQGLEKHTGFSRQFDVLRLESMTEEEARPIVRAVVDQWEFDHAVEKNVRVTFPDRAVDCVIELSRDFFPGQHFPGKALRLAEQVVQGELENTLETPAEARQTIVTQDMVVEALERVTGIPRRLLDDTSPLDLEEVHKFFESRVVGQSDAVSTVVDLITLIKAGVTDPKKPMGVLLFVGPTGVGKTELAKALAEFIFGSQERLVRYDMSEYKEYSSFEKLIGVPQAGATSALSRGSLISQIRQQPFSVILFDEIEKAHPNIFDLFLQLFDDGRLTDPAGQVTNFTKTIIIMTSNLGSDLRRSASLGFTKEQQSAQDDPIVSAVEGYFRPEFLNRLDRIVRFQALKRQQMRIIAQRELGRVLLRSGITRRNLRVDIDPGVIDVLLAEGFSSVYGARPLKRAVERLALLPIARQMVKMTDADKATLLRLQPAGKRIVVRLVQDPQSRQALPVTTPVRVSDPLHDHTIKLSPDQIRERVERLGARVGELESQCRQSQLPERKAGLLQQTGQVDFWDDAQHARAVLGEIHRLERLVEAVDRVRKRADDLRAGLDTAVADPRLLAGMAERAFEIDQHVDLVEYSLACREPLEQADAVVCITLVDQEPAEDDIVGMLCDMYDHWARLKGFHVSILHEELSEAGLARRLVLLIDGVSVFGILRGEEGIHEFLWGRTSKQPKTIRFVRVRVMPIVEPQADISVRQMERKHRAAKGAGGRVKRYRSEVLVTHKPTHMSVQACNGLSRSQSLELCSEWLRAELARREMAANLPAAASETIVRKYTLRPTSSAKDQRTHVSTNDLRELWNGGLDLFLHATLGAESNHPGKPVAG